MKTRILVLVALILIGTIEGYARKKVDGNGNVVTKSVQVTNYTSVEIGSGIEHSTRLYKHDSNKSPAFNYTQAKGNASFQITIDENLFPLLEIKSVGGTLSIEVKDRAIMNPTKLIIKSQSEGLNNIRISGCVDFVFDNAFTSDKLTLKLSGAGDVSMKNATRVGEFNATISGASDMVADNLVCEKMDCGISGAGDFNLKGKADKAKFRISGAGDLEAFDFEVKDLECSVSGAGDLDVYATGTLNASVSGTGDIRYKGNATANTHVSGLGDIRKVN